MSDWFAQHERRVGAGVVALAVGLVGTLLVVAAMVGPPSESPPVAKEPTPAMDPVKPSDPAIAPVAAAAPTASPGPAVKGPRTSGVVEPTPRVARIDSTWVSKVSRLTGIGSVALEAYGNGTLRVADEQPGCHVGWTTLAGIGGIESGHGTTGGAALRADGTTTRPIVGPALDGSAGTSRIPSDSQSARWHGDSRWDHAVGPMQFIPSTWRRWASDGNDDGVADPNNVSDAAYAAARYLCASGADLQTVTGWTQAVFSYNHSERYVRSVLARADQYGNLSVGQQRE